MIPLAVKRLSGQILALKKSAVNSTGSQNPVWAFGRSYRISDSSRRWTKSLRGGMSLLEAGINRVQLCKERAVAVGSQLKKLDTLRRKSSKDRETAPNKTAPTAEPLARRPLRQNRERTR